MCPEDEPLDHAARWDYKVTKGSSSVSTTEREHFRWERGIADFDGNEVGRRTMVREVFLVLQKGVEVPSCCERDILRYEKGIEMGCGLEGFGTAK